MSTSIPALVEPSVLRWARETVDLAPVAAARKLGLPDDRVTAWEEAREQPTIAQLRRAATLYKRSLGVFFLPEPPEGFDTLRDFRRRDGAASGAWSPALHAEYRRAHLQREYVLELAEIDDVEPSAAWMLPNAPQDDNEHLATAARANLLDVSPLPLPSPAGTVYEHLNTWVAALEESGVLVMATGRGNVLPSEMRGFSLYFEDTPVIVVNGADFPRGRLFTLLHEYAHLILHTAGLCDTVADTHATTPDRRLEARCNAIAASMLMPRRKILALPEVIERHGRQEEWTYETLTSAARAFGVSAEAFLRRLVTLQQVDVAYYRARRAEFLDRYEEEEARNRATGGNWYRNTVRDLGKGYVRLVTDAHRRRAIDSYTAATYLNAKVGQIPKLAQYAALREAS